MKQHLMAARKSPRTYLRYLRIQYYHFHKVEKKILFLTVSLQLVFFALQAQTSNSRWKENFDIHKFRTEIIDIDAPVAAITLKKIQGITITDARADTSAIGFMQKKIVDPITGGFGHAANTQTEQRINKRPTFIVLSNGLQKDATAYLSHLMSFGNNNSLPAVLMVIKKLWLSDELNIGNDKGNGFAGTDRKDVWTSGVDVTVEFYLRSGADYYALYRYDSVISEAMTISEYGPQFVEKALHLSVQKMMQMEGKIAAIMNKRKFSLQEIEQHNENEFNMPVLKDSTLNAGVYLTFEEFKNNNPSQTVFELRKDKLTDNIYLKQSDGKEYLERNVWGYSDGKNAFVRSANNFFLLQRKINAFYIFGAKRIKREESSSSGMGGYYGGGTTVAAPYNVTYTKTTAELEPFQLDWSTGELY